MHDLGAEVVGIDKGDNEGEEFEHYRKDLTEKGSLNFLKDKSFDMILIQAFLDSPALGLGYKNYNNNSVCDELLSQMRRLVKEDGYIAVHPSK